MAYSPILPEDPQGDASNTTLGSHHLRLRTGPGLVVGKVSLSPASEHAHLDPVPWPSSSRLFRSRSHASAVSFQQSRANRTPPAPVHRDSASSTTTESSGCGRTYSTFGSFSSVEEEGGHKQSVPIRPAAVRTSTFGQSFDGVWTPSPGSSTLDLSPEATPNLFDGLHTPWGADFGWRRSGSPGAAQRSYFELIKTSPQHQVKADQAAQHQTRFDNVDLTTASMQSPLGPNTCAFASNTGSSGMTKSVDHSTYSVPPTPVSLSISTSNLPLSGPHVPAYLIRSPMRSPALNFPRQSPPADERSPLDKAIIVPGEWQEEVDVYHLPASAIEARSFSEHMPLQHTPPIGALGLVVPEHGESILQPDWSSRWPLVQSLPSSPNTYVPGNLAPPVKHSSLLFSSLSSNPVGKYSASSEVDYFSVHWHTIGSPTEASLDSPPIGCEDLFRTLVIDEQFPLPDGGGSRTTARQRSRTLPACELGNSTSSIPGLSQSLRPPKSPKRQSDLLSGDIHEGSSVSPLLRKTHSHAHPPLRPLRSPLRPDFVVLNSPTSHGRLRSSTEPCITSYSPAIASQDVEVEFLRDLRSSRGVTAMSGRPA